MTFDPPSWAQPSELNGSRCTDCGKTLYKSGPGVFLTILGNKVCKFSVSGLHIPAPLGVEY